MTAVPTPDRELSDSVTVSSGPRPVFDVKPAEGRLASSEAATSIDHDLRTLHEIAARQRLRAAARTIEQRAVVGGEASAPLANSGC